MKSTMSQNSSLGGLLASFRKLFLVAFWFTLTTNFGLVHSGVKCPTMPAFPCFCSPVEENRYGGWELNCDEYRIAYTVKSLVALECSPEAPYEEAMFEKLDITDVEVFHFKYCPLPNTTFKELLKGMSVTKLIVEGSPVQQRNVPEDAFQGLDQLEQLSLKSSHLTTIGQNVFQNLTSLKRLFLEDNQLRELPETVFESLSELVLLQLASNQLETLPVSIFANLTKLQRLYLYSNRLTDLPEGLLRGLEALQVLDIGNNRIQIVKANMFLGATQLAHLNLKGNDLTEVEGDALTNVLNLVELDLSDNQNVTQLPQNLLANLTKLSKFKMNSCKIETFPTGFFSQAENLTSVSVFNNLLTLIDEDLFVGNPNLEELDLKYNNLTVLPAGLFRKSSKLKRLVLAMNHFQSFPEDLFDHVPSLITLQLRGNRLQTLDSDWLKRVQLEELDVSNNTIVSLVGSQPFGSNKKLKRIDCSANNLTRIPAINWDSYLKLEDINFKDNQITFLDVPNFLSENVKFDLENNRIESVSVEEIVLVEFAQEHYAKTVQTRAEYNLKGNTFNCDCRLWDFVRYVKDYPGDHLVRFPNADELTCYHPENQRNVKLLQLAAENFACDVDSDCPSTCDCRLRAVDRATFVKCANLTELPSELPFNTTEVYLEDNGISNLDALQDSLWENVTVLVLDNNNLTTDEFVIPPKLKALSLIGNQLDVLPETLSAYVQNKPDFRLYLADNPWYCDCSTLKFKDWLHENAKKVQDIEKINCQNTVYQNGSNSSPLVVRLTDELCPQEDNEIDNAKLISVSIVCVILALLLFVVSVLYYRNKQTLTAYIYIHFYKVFVCFFNEEEFDEDKTFDAFISYSTADREVAMALMNELEIGEADQPKFKLCIHERDWLPGNLISWNIVNSVQNSRKTILVLSKDFLDSVWFQVEFHTAYYQMLEDRIDRLIVIVRGELPQKSNLDKDLQLLLSTKTYLEWGERWFWEKLRFALPHRRELQNGAGLGQSRTEKMALRQRPNKSLLKTVEQRIANLTANESPEQNHHELKSKSNGTTAIATVPGINDKDFTKSRHPTINVAPTTTTNTINNTTTTNKPNLSYPSPETVPINNNSNKFEQEQKSKGHSSPLTELTLMTSPAPGEIKSLRPNSNNHRQGNVNKAFVITG